MSYDNKVAVVGLGYVGLTLATVLAEVGFQVIGVEKRPEVVNATNSGEPHFSETGLSGAIRRVVRSGALTARTSFAQSDQCLVYIITVGTPLDPNGLARLDMIENASRQVADVMPDGALVILRSTVKIGTTRTVVMPILAESGKQFHLAMCPERTLEGKALQELRELPQIIGADDSLSRDKASKVFRKLTDSIVEVSSLEAAEIVKLVDNTYRDVQFAFANEVARLCEAFEVSAHEVISSGKLGYSRTNVAMPGLVGGPCLEKDPHILAQSARGKGLELEVTRASRFVNERQPVETVDFILRQMKMRRMDAAVKICILGIAFKGMPETDDLRGAMSLKVIDAISAARPDIKIYGFDPVIRFEDIGAIVKGVKLCRTLEDAVADSSVVVITNNHPCFGRQQPARLFEMMSSNGFIYDYWNHFSSLSDEGAMDSYFAVGNTKGAGL